MGKEAELTTDYKFADFVMVGRVNARYYGLAVSTKSPYRSLADLQKASAARPKGKPLRMGGIGLTTANAVNATLALPMMKLQFTYIGGMKGSADAIVACMRGDLDMLFYPCETYTEFVKSGDLRILFHTGPNRDKDFPDVPVVKELGFPQLEGLAMSVVVMGPPRLPENIRAALEKALVQAGRDPETQAWSERMKIPMEPLTQKEFEPVIIRAKNLMKNYAALLKQYESWQKP
jgi:tripartite-type tricarboxylate transporter receptor subunit TctC